MVRHKLCGDVTVEACLKAELGQDYGQTEAFAGVSDESCSER